MSDFTPAIIRETIQCPVGKSLLVKGTRVWIDERTRRPGGTIVTVRLGEDPENAAWWGARLDELIETLKVPSLFE